MLMVGGHCLIYALINQYHHWINKLISVSYNVITDSLSENLVMKDTENGYWHNETFVHTI